MSKRWVMRLPSAMPRDRSAARDGAVLGLAGHLSQKGKSGGAGSPYSCIWQLKQTP